jgi:hypothetical protein
MKLSRVIALKATLLGAMALPMLMVPAYGQQEIDPTWYDPWPAATKTAAQPTAAKAADSKNHRKVTAASVQQRKSKLRAHAAHPAGQTQAMLSTK